MGYIGTGTTNIITTTYLTQKGREYLSTGNKAAFNVSFFALGDSDVNYNIVNITDDGSIPDLTGNNFNCINSIASNIDIKYKINSV